MTVCLNYELRMLRNREADKYIDRFLAIFGRDRETEKVTETNRQRERNTHTHIERVKLTGFATNGK